MPNYLTKQGLKDLEEELKKIRGKSLPQVLQALNIAREEGDLKENASYQSALKQKDELEARAGELEEILNDYLLINEDGIDNDKVQIGNTVVVEFLATKNTMEVKIVGSSEANALEGRISNESPLALAILGKKPKTEVDYKAPQGKTKVKILKISQ